MTIVVFSVLFDKATDLVLYTAELDKPWVIPGLTAHVAGSDWRSLGANLYFSKCNALLIDNQVILCCLIVKLLLQYFTRRYCRCHCYLFFTKHIYSRTQWNSTSYSGSGVCINVIGKIRRGRNCFLDIEVIIAKPI